MWLGTQADWSSDIVALLIQAFSGTPSQIAYLVQNGGIRILCQRLAEFKTYDRVLTDIYKYVGATYNFELVSDALQALLNIVNVGEMESEDFGQVNKNALAFDLEGIRLFLFS